jgi:hypothetical protein
MTCKHGYIGPCAECDGSGQVPSDSADAWQEILEEDYHVTEDGERIFIPRPRKQ